MGRDTERDLIKENNYPHPTLQNRRIIIKKMTTINKQINITAALFGVNMNFSKWMCIIVNDSSVNYAIPRKKNSSSIIIKSKCNKVSSYADIT